MVYPNEISEAPVYKTAEMPVEAYRQVADMLMKSDLRTFKGNDTASPVLPDCQFYDSAQPVDSMPSKTGRNFQFDKEGNVNYRITSKDYRGLNDVVTDYMTTRDGQRPTAEQVRKMVDQIAKDPANKITDVNNIRVGQNLRFPGPERAQILQCTNLQSNNRPKDTAPRYPVEQRNAPEYPARAEFAPNRKPEDPKGEKILRNRDDQKIDNGDGSFTRVWKGQVEDGGIFASRTKTQGWEKTDRFGNLIQSEMHFNKPKSIEIPKDRNSHENVDARKIEKQFDSKNGMTYTRVTTETGDVLVYRTNASGQSERYDTKTGRWK